MALLETDFGQDGFPQGGFAPLVTKLRPPRPPLDLVERAALLSALRESRAPLIVMAAPAGSGKTVALMQWADQESAPVGWLALDAADNDPMVLLTYLAMALQPMVTFDEQLARWLHSQAPPVRERILPAFADALQAAPAFRLVLDDAHLLTSSFAWQIIDFLIAALPPETQLVLGSRNEPALPLARLRAAGRAQDFGLKDLQLSVDETAELLRLQHVAADPATASALRAGTEGWATGVYLAALSGVGRPPEEWLRAVSGQHRDIARYFAAEVLGRQPDAVRDFLLRTSILDRLSAGLCRAVTGDESAATLLEGLARGNLFVSSLDDRDEWYRYHHLFADFLRGELERQHGDELRELHCRAAERCAEAGLLEEALRHWLAAGEAGRAGDIVCGSYTAYVGHGRGGTLWRWLDFFTDEQILSSTPLTLTAGWLESMSGDATHPRRWVAAAMRARVDDRPSPDGAVSLRSSQASLGAGIGGDGVAKMRADAELACALEAEGHPSWRAGCATILGVACWLDGDGVEAERHFRRAAEEGSVHNTLAETGALGYLAQVLADRGDWAEAARVAEVGQRRVEECDFAWAATLGPALAVARVHCHSGEPRAAEETHMLADTLGQLSPPPWIGVSSAVLLAETFLALGDVPEADRWRQSGVRWMRDWPDAGMLRGRLERLRVALQERRGIEPLTGAEQRVLQLLPTRLTEKAMARDLAVSPNTVKTHVHEIFRKLGAHTRADAVERARRLGLLNE